MTASPNHERLLQRIDALERENAELSGRLARGAEEPRRLVHELQVHQLELETQNQALREAQSALEVSRNRYAELYDLAPVAYCTFDAAGTLVELNLTAATMLGVERAEAVGRPFSSFARAMDGALEEHLQRTLESRTPTLRELSLVTARGQLELQAVSTPVFDAGGEVTTCRTVFLDIAPRVRAERALAAAHEDERALRGLLEALDRASLAVGRAMARLPGTDVQPLLQLVVDEAHALAPSDGAIVELSARAGHGPLRASSGASAGLDAAPVVRRALDLCVSLGRGVRWHDSVGPGPWPRSTLAVPIVAGERTLGALCLVDKRRAAAFDEPDERALTMLVERLAVSLEIARLREVEAREHARVRFLAQTSTALAEGLEDPSLLQVLVRMNVPANADLCSIEVSAPELGGHAAYAEDPAIAEQVRGLLGRTWSLWRKEALRSGQPVLRTEVDLEREVLDPSARELARAIGLQSTLVVPLVARGQVIGLLELSMLGSGRRFAADDVPLVQELARHVSLAVDNARLYRRAQRAIRSRDDVVAVVAHDLRTPLQSAVLGLSLLSDRAGDPESQVTIRRLERALSSADRLISDLLDVTRVETGRLSLDQRPVPTREVMTEAAETVALQAEQASVAIQVGDDLQRSTVLADPDRLAQVFSNLMGNAIKFTPAGGEVRVSALRRGHEICFSVADTGKGMGAEDLRHLFDRFWQAAGDRRGVGLGLWITRGIVEAHGGRIWAESTPGCGTTVHFTIPAADAPHPRAPHGSASDPGRPRREV